MITGSAPAVLAKTVIAHVMHHVFQQKVEENIQWNKVIASMKQLRINNTKLVFLDRKSFKVSRIKLQTYAQMHAQRNREICSWKCLVE